MNATPTINLGEFKLVERADATPNTWKSADNGSALGDLANALGSLLGQTVETIGKILGGATGLAIGAFEWVLSGLQNVVKDIFQFFGTLFTKNPAPIYPEYLSPIKADLEGAVAPMIQRLKDIDAGIDESHSQIAALVTEQRKLTTDMQGIVDDQAQALENMKNLLRGEWAQAETRLKETSSQISSKVDELVTFKDGMDARLQQHAAQIKADINVAGKINAALGDAAADVTRRLAEGGDIAAKMKSMSDSAAKPFGDWWRANGARWTEMQEWYNDWNNDQWAMQSTVNDLQKNFNAKVISALNSQTKINADQVSFNTFVSKLWTLQKEYNERNDTLWDMQKKFNDKSEGFAALQLDFNTKSTAWQLKQEDINDDFIRVQGQLQAKDTELQRLNEEMMEYIPRKLVAKKSMGGGVTTNAHWKVDMNAGTMTALGSWHGEVAVRKYGTTYEHASVSGGEGGSVTVSQPISNEYLEQIPTATGSRVIKIEPFPGRYTANGPVHTVALEYFIYRGTPMRSLSERTSSKTSLSRSTWTTLRTFKATDSVQHRLFFYLTWDASQYDPQYSVRIRVNGVTKAQIGPKTRVGPLTILGNGVRPMNLGEISIALTKGDSVTFEAYSTASDDWARVIKTWSTNAAWTRPPS